MSEVTDTGSRAWGGRVGGMALGKGSGITTRVLGCRGLSKVSGGALKARLERARGRGHAFPQDIPRKGSEVSSRLPFPDEDPLPLPSFVHSLCLVTSRPPPHIRQDTSFPHPFLLRLLIPALLPTASCIVCPPPHPVTARPTS